MVLVYVHTSSALRTLLFHFDGLLYALIVEQVATLGRCEVVLQLCQADTATLSFDQLVLKFLHSIGYLILYFYLILSWFDFSKLLEVFF